MKTTTFKNNWLTAAGFLLVIPTAYFISAGVLSEFGINGPINTIQSTAEKWGIKEGLGWNINLLILFGPALAFLLTIFQVLKIEWHITKEEFLVNLAIQKRWFPLLVVVLSIGLLGLLFLYAIGENCNG
jgi:hypothetical protein